ncbi:interleukin-20 receptor subunit beta isoform X3 [Bubalus kerabau]|uniref:interleukin-20 receptor subunit beta isoform X3 n=1 Tax=Bubalus carabanensis TaxID=3119969 RepID=UPI00244EE6E2|nr:interleukin-20 receptor subunit beta isoform X3 [Bubalus carabanensis]
MPGLVRSDRGGLSVSSPSGERKDACGLHGVAVLPAPQNLSVQSTNMKHVLTWSPVIVPEEIVHYSVEYQGEYESLYTSHIWIPSSWCSSTQRPECDITEDITATVSYSLRVRATLGLLTSAWSTLKHRFNQNSTILTPPGMEITMDGFHLLIKLEDLGPHFEFFVSYWRREPGAKEHVKVVKPGVLPVYLETVEPGAAYCVKARTFVKAIGRHSAFSRTECVKVQGCMGSGGEIVLCSNPHPNPEVKVHPHLTKGGSLGSYLAHFPPESF